MSDVVSIELLLDEASEALVREDWTALARAGMSSLGAHPSPSNRPHITLLVRPSLASVTFSRAVAMLPVRLRLGEPIVFAHGDRGVLARRIELTDQLRSLHEAVHATVSSGADAAHTAPGEWTPHVTLARRLLLDSLTDALALLHPPRDATGTMLRRWDSASASITPLGGGPVEQAPVES